jgi:hypothetical protein
MGGHRKQRRPDAGHKLAVWGRYVSREVGVMNEWNSINIDHIRCVIHAEDARLNRLCSLVDNIKKLLPELEDLVAGWEPSQDFQDVIETAEEKQQREEWATIKTGLELLEQAAIELEREL